MILGEPVKFSELFKYRYVFEDLDGNPMLKAVVDAGRELIAIDGELHADLEQLLLENGSQQWDLWGINLIIEKQKIDIDALINIRPPQNNRHRGIDNPETEKKVIEVAEKWIKS